MAGDQLYVDLHLSSVVGGVNQQPGAKPVPVIHQGLRGFHAKDRLVLAGPAPLRVRGAARRRAFSLETLKASRPSTPRRSTRTADGNGSASTL